jgi:protein-tyrosine-phosphatase
MPKVVRVDSARWLTRWQDWALGKDCHGGRGDHPWSKGFVVTKNAAVVTMGCGDACPWIPAAVREDWELRDPKGLADDQFRAIHDDIEQRVVALLKQLSAG